MISATIVNGPSKFDLMLALFNRKVVNQDGVIFAVEPHIKLSTIVTGVTAENGSGEFWVVDGYARFVGDPMAPPRNVKVWFHTDTRKGQLEFS